MQGIPETVEHGGGDLDVHVDLLVAAHQHGVRGIPETVKHGGSALGVHVDLFVAACQCKVYLGQSNMAVVLLLSMSTWTCW